MCSEMVKSCVLISKDKASLNNLARNFYLSADGVIS